MSMNDLTNNTTMLEEVLDMVENLPEAGNGGSGGVEYEIGTFTIANMSYPNLEFHKFPFIIGQTWEEFINSPLNVEFNSHNAYYKKIAIIKNNEVFSYNALGENRLSLINNDPDSVVKPSDLIQNNTTYNFYTPSMGGQ